MHLTMQLKPEYKKQLDPAFLAWYLGEFKSDRLIHDHWSAGMRSTNFDDYHAVTVLTDDVHTIINADVMTDLHGHTDGRNVNSIGLCIAGMYGGGPDNLGSNVPTPAQIRAHQAFIVAICCNHRIPIGNYGTHQERADMLDYQEAGIDPYDPSNLGAPPYGPIYGRGQWACYRWDWYVDIDPASLRLYPHSDPVPAGREFYPDWMRGQLALEIQRRTVTYWRKSPHVAVPTGGARDHGEGR